MSNAKALHNTEQNSKHSMGDHLHCTNVFEYIRDPKLLLKSPVSVRLDNDSELELIKLLRRTDHPIINYMYDCDGWTPLGKTKLIWPKAHTDWLDTAVKSDIIDITPLMSAIMAVGDPAALVERHIAILCELCGYSPHINIFTDLCVFHTYICGYYSLMDSNCDGHAPSAYAFLDAGPLLSAAYERLQKLLSDLPPSVFREFSAKLTSSLFDQRNSLIAEKKFQSQPLVCAEADEKETIIDRANCVFLTIDLISILASQTVSPKIIRGLKDYIYWSQLADDLGDWREDYRRQNFTSFLRSCFSLIGYVPEEDTLEKTVYLYGQYEWRLVSIIKGMNALGSKFVKESQKFPLTRGIILGERQRSLSILNEFIGIKTTFLQC